MQKFVNTPSRLLFWVLLIIQAVACSKPEMTTHEGFPVMYYDRGLPDGGFAEKTIDASGGIISSTDGRLKLSIPAGALNSAVVVSIQAISNTVPLGTGPAFRISPSTISLSKPVTVTLAYNEAALDGLDEEALDITTQDNTGMWARMKRTQLNKDNKTLSVETRHFGDFSFNGHYLLKPAKAGLTAGETTKLTVYTLQELNTTDEEDEAPFGAIIPLENADDFEAWNASGPGSISGSGSSADFTAPSSINGTETTDVTVTLKNVKRPARLPDGKLFLRKKILMAAENFMAGYYDGQPFNCTGVSVLAGGGITTIQGLTATGKSVLIIVHGADVGNYPFGSLSEAGKSEIRCDIIGGVYETVYTICGSPATTAYSGGLMRINGYQNGATIAGEFSATLYDDAGCQIKTKSMSGSFRAKM